METWAIALIIAGAVILLIVLLVLLYMLRSSLQRKNGVLAESLVTGKLNRFAKIRSFKVLENLTFPSGKNDPVTVDRVLVTFNHVLLFQIRSECDTIYGDAKDPTWVSIKTDKENNTTGRVAFGNPVRDAQRANDAVRRLLARNKLGKVRPGLCRLRRPEGHPVDRAGDAGLKLQGLKGAPRQLPSIRRTARWTSKRWQSFSTGREITIG